MRDSLTVKSLPPLCSSLELYCPSFISICPETQIPPDLSLCVYPSELQSLGCHLVIPALPLAWLSDCVNSGDWHWNRGRTSRQVECKHLGNVRTCLWLALSVQSKAQLWSVLVPVCLNVCVCVWDLKVYLTCFYKDFSRSWWPNEHNTAAIKERVL